MMHMQDLDLIIFSQGKNPKKSLACQLAVHASHDSWPYIILMGRRSMSRPSPTETRLHLIGASCLPSYTTQLVPTWQQLVHTHADMHG